MQNVRIKSYFLGLQVLWKNVNYVYKYLTQWHSLKGWNRKFGGHFSAAACCRKYLEHHPITMVMMYALKCVFDAYVVNQQLNLLYVLQNIHFTNIEDSASKKIYFILFTQISNSDLSILFTSVRHLKICRHFDILILLFLLCIVFYKYHMNPYNCYNSRNCEEMLEKYASKNLMYNYVTIRNLILIRQSNTISENNTAW